MSNTSPMTDQQAAHELDKLVAAGKRNTPEAQAFAAVIALHGQLRFYVERERFFATALDVSDGGRYRNDWPGALERLIRERDRLLEENKALRDAADDRGDAFDHDRDVP